MINRTTAIIVAMALGLFYAVSLAANEKDHDMTETPQGQMTRWCMGRHVIDAPAGFVRLEGYHFIDGMEVDHLGPGDPNALRDVVAARRASLRDGRAEDQGVPLVFRDERTAGRASVLASHPDMAAMGVTPEDWTEEAYISTGGQMFRITGLIEGANAPTMQGKLDRLAGAVRPRTPDDIPGPNGACIDTAFVAKPTQSEIHGLTLIPESGEKPIGYTFEVILRAPDAPQLDVDTRFDSPAAKPVQIDGHSGHQLMLLDGQVGFAAIAGKSGGAGTWGTQITVEYYDERSDFGTDPMTREQAEAWWPVVLGSIKGSVLR